MKKNIAILSGGDSPEYIISVKSAEQVLNWINTEKYNPHLITVKGNHWEIKKDGTSVPVDLRDFSINTDGSRIRFDYAYIIIHGNPGENGKIQAYLEMQKIPYNTGGVLSTALTFNKYACKHFLKNSGILTPESVLLKKHDEVNYDTIKDRIGLPCFVKPNSGGSSFGASRVNRMEEFPSAIEKASEEDGEVLIESYIKGTELSCGLVKTRSAELIFPVTEIIPKNEFFDYEAKYIEGMAEEITPATLPDEIQKRCRNISSEIYDILNCRGIVRIDYIAKGNQLYFLELNSIPGMTRESIVPKQIRTMDLKIEDVIDMIISDTISS